MYTISREFSFCYGHRLLDYNGKCAHVHGHNGHAILTLESESLDSRGMVLDFGDLKAGIGAWIEEEIDHKMLLQKDDPLVPVLLAANEPLYLMDVNPTAENIARLLYEKAEAMNYPIHRVEFRETAKCTASYSKTSEREA